MKIAEFDRPYNFCIRLPVQLYVEPFSSYLTVKMWCHPKSLEMTPFARSHRGSYSSYIVTMTISCIVSEIKQDMCRKSRFFHTHFYITTPPRWGKRLRLFSRHFLHNRGMVRLQCDAKILRKSSTVWLWVENTNVIDIRQMTDGIAIAERNLVTFI